VEEEGADLMEEEEGFLEVGEVDLMEDDLVCGEVEEAGRLTGEEETPLIIPAHTIKLSVVRNPK
jgi:hypothetical protein